MVPHQLHHMLQTGPQDLPGMELIRMHTNRLQLIINMTMDLTIPNIMQPTMTTPQMTSMDQVVTSMIKQYQ